eukprot:TRINITY_DN4721_c6_g1_i1.p1 TRINITY_DN4721_c6_g1~~TRINITY_DN4721_c6_g1_i1.p1  ORF type:complete len:251 (+),score=75.64 TRINITY_DN4721_c6_g1_i1:136-888(+)
MRRTSALLVALEQQFVYRKVKSDGDLSEVTSVIGCAQVYALNAEEREAMDAAFKYTKPVQITLMPTFDHAFPSYWRQVEKLAYTHSLDGVFCEGFSEDYIRRPAFGITENEQRNVMGRLERWRKQRAPWPWALNYPTKNLGGDVHNYSLFQRLFPQYRPKGTEEEDRQRVWDAWCNMRRITLDYRITIGGMLYSHRLCPYISDLLEGEGYRKTVKVELEAGSSVNHLYGETYAELLDVASRAMEPPRQKS